MSIKIIAAIDKNYGLGFNNDLLFRISEDMKQFKELTTGHFIVMGRKTFQSLPNTLPNRTNVVLSRNGEFPHPSEVFVMDSVEHIINHYNSGDQDKDIWVIGGESIYREFLPYADEVYLTHIDKEADKVDTYFPKDELKELFAVKDYSEWHYSEEEECKYCFVTYRHK